MGDFYKDLEQYFRNTSPEQVKKDWEKSEECDKVGPPVSKFLEEYPLTSNECFEKGDVTIEQMKNNKNMNEIEKCKNSMVYFYNNYLRKVGDPEVKEDYFEELAKLKKINDTVNLISPRNWSKSFNHGK